MPRKKIEADITSLGRSDKLTVQKSLPLFALWRSDLTLAEFKILDTYLSRIDSHKPDRRVVMFEKGELEKILGVKKINHQVLEERLKHLMGNVVKLPNADESDRKGFQLITLFEEAVAEQDEYGLWQVKLECTQKAMQYIFNIENLGYLRYKLRCITSITSRYTYIMFTYLEANRYRKTWEVHLQELKELLHCEQEAIYREFKFFNQKILKRVHKEMLEKTECRYDYEPIKRGRSVVAIRFTIETQKSAAADPEQITVDQYLQNATGADLWVSALDEFRFTVEQIDGIRSVLVMVPDHKLPQSPEWYDSNDLRRYHYMRMISADITQRNADRTIRNKYAYLMTILKRDAGIQ